MHKEIFVLLSVFVSWRQGMMNRITGVQVCDARDHHRIIAADPIKIIPHKIDFPGKV